MANNPNPAETVVSINAADLVVGSGGNIETGVRRAAFAIFEEWFETDTIEAIRYADGLVGRDMANVEDKDHRAAFTNLEELIDDPVIIDALKYTENWGGGRP